MPATFIDSEVVELYLRSLGFTQVELSAEIRKAHFYGQPAVNVEIATFEYDGQTLQIDTDSFDIGDDLNKILRNAQKYTCCGDLIEYDGDSDLCPTCHEHC